MLVHRAVPENTPNKTSPAVKKKAVRLFTHDAKYLKDNTHNILYFARKYSYTFVLGYYLFFEEHSFRERSSRKTARILEQTMSADNTHAYFGSK